MVIFQVRKLRPRKQGNLLDWSAAQVDIFILSEWEQWHISISHEAIFIELNSKSTQLFSVWLFDTCKLLTLNFILTGNMQEKTVLSGRNDTYDTSETHVCISIVFPFWELVYLIVNVETDPFVNNCAYISTLGSDFRYFRWILIILNFCFFSFYSGQTQILSAHSLIHSFSECWVPTIC